MADIDPFAESVLFACLPMAHAWDMLHDVDVSGSLNMEQYFDLCKAAGLDDATASQAAAQRGAARLRKELPA